MTYSENTQHAYDTGLCNIGKGRDRPVIQLTLNGEFIKRFPSIKEAKKETKATNVSLVCKNVYEQSGGFKWRYEDCYDPFKEYIDNVFLKMFIDINKEDIIYKESELEAMNILKLRKILKEKSLCATGNKKELINKILKSYQWC
jgi:hypothetical protein